MYREEPTHDLCGVVLPQPFVARDLMRPDPPRATTPPCSSEGPFKDPFEETEAGIGVELTGEKFQPALGMSAIFEIKP